MAESITIAGAGLAGSLLAIFLRKRGFNVTVFERRPDMRKENLDAGRSINLALANRGLRALEAVGLADEVQKLLITMKGRMLHETDGNLQLQAYGRNDQEVIYSISRPGLNALLLNEAERQGADLRFNQQLDQVNLNTAEATFTDRNSDTRFTRNCAPLIATDGSGSIARRTMGFAPGANSSEEFLEHGYKELTIPADNGKHQIETNALHIWPRGGLMLIALPNLDGSFTVTLFMPREGKISFASLTSPEKVTQFFTDTFPDATALMPQLAEEYFENPTGRLVTVRCKPWYRKDKVLLLGDAAHAIVPFHGQGMNCAFEDCFIFDKILAEESSDSVDWRSVFALFQAERLENANAIADLALDNYIVMRDSVRDPRFHLKKQLSWELEKRFPNSFIPRYSMVMFHEIPYSVALKRGVIQESILEELIGDDESLDYVEYNIAEQMIEQRLGAVL